jgi:DNA-binding NarL/FixJ family response regulator
MPRPANTKLYSAVPLAQDVERLNGISMVLIERRTLLRECFAAGLQRASGYHVLAFATVDEWLQSGSVGQACMIVLCAGDVQESEACRQISALAKTAESLPLIVICDGEDAGQVVKVLEAGAKGVIPASLPLAVAVEAMRLVTVGGTFVPASCVTALQRSCEDSTTSESNGKGLFTSRQAAVIEALRRGKANKIIAYELNMRESTVKVHVRNIMKKLKARNRTEVAYIANGMMSPEGERQVASVGQSSL